jgi:hypothetical protein
VPLSLGNDEDVLESAVCDACQNYLSHSVEKPALEKTPIAFWRAYQGIRTRKGRLPSARLLPPNGGKIPATHPLTDAVGFTAHPDGSTSVDIDDSFLIRDIFEGDKTDFKLVLSPWHILVLGRFLGKMGLEYVALTDYARALSVNFDKLRSYVRYGSSRALWPIFWGSQGELADLKGPMIAVDDCIEQEIECYRYALGETVHGELLFAFSMGLDVMLICLSHSRPVPELAEVIQDAKLNCVWYPEGSW